MLRVTKRVTFHPSIVAPPSRRRAHAPSPSDIPPCAAAVCATVAAFLLSAAKCLTESHGVVMAASQAIPAWGVAR